jgi:proteasome lid subunit RPN8/RPN11
VGASLSTTLEITADILKQIHSHGEAAYPEEGAGLLFGEANGDRKRVVSILGLNNAREQSARHNRYLITPQDMLSGEEQALRLSLDVVGVFHSHPDHPNRPSEFDREWAMPWYSYVITSVNGGRAIESRSWRLEEDRSAFIEEQIQVIGEPLPVTRTQETNS